MESTEQEHLRTKYSQRLEIRYRIVELFVIAIIALITGYSIILAVRKDNDNTRGYIQCIISTDYSDQYVAKKALDQCAIKYLGEV